MQQREGKMERRGRRTGRLLAVSCIAGVLGWLLPPAAEAQEPPNLLSLSQGAVLVDASRDPAKALALTDGDPASTWSSATKRYPPPYTFTFELMAPATLTAVGVTGAGKRPGGVAGGSARTIVVEGSGGARDGGFQPLATISAADEGVTMAAVSAAEPVRVLRFTVTDAQSPDVTFFYLGDVIAHGAMAAPDDPARFTGIFQTGRATLIELKQEGAAITGCYSDNSGRTLGTLRGDVREGVALLAWRSDQGIEGTALLTIDSAGALRGVRYRQRSRSAWGGPPAPAGATTQCSAAPPPANPVADALANDGEVKLYGILFNHDSDVPRSISLPALRQLRDALAQNPDMAVVIEGHTDADGSDSYNMDLSARRAAAVVAWLTDNGIAAGRLTPVGKGESEPVASNKTVDGKALNRRVEAAVR